MNAKTTIRKFLFVSIWLVIGGGMLTLLIAAIGKKHRDQCRGYEIRFKDSPNIFVDDKEVAKILVNAAEGPVQGQSIASIKLHQLENQLEANTWIRNAELYFDNRDILQVIISEKEPVARIFTTGGNSFYIDSQAKRMPLSEKLSARVPVFTGFPDKKQLSDKDSALLLDLRKTALFISKDSFWSSQVAQIDIAPDRRMEMIPVVGNHIVRLGNADNLDQKFYRLLVFYRQVMSKTGFDKYKVVDVQYDGQVLASKKPENNNVDSAQLRKNVEKLLHEAQQAEEEADALAPNQPGPYGFYFHPDL